MTINTTSQVNTNALPVNVKIGLNGLIAVEAQGESGDSLQAVLVAALNELGQVAEDYINDDGTLRETVTILSGGVARQAANVEDGVEPGSTVIVNQPAKNG